jgi:hypothetical protein
VKDSVYAQVAAGKGALAGADNMLASKLTEAGSILVPFLTGGLSSCSWQSVYRLQVIQLRTIGKARGLYRL